MDILWARKYLFLELNPFSECGEWLKGGLSHCFKVNTRGQVKISGPDHSV